MGMGLYDRKKHAADRAELVRERFNRYYGVKGHGALKEVASKTGYSRQHVGTFRNGGSVSDDMVNNIDGALDQLEAELGVGPMGFLADDPALLIADELEALVRTLRAQSFDHDHKIERFVSAIDYFHGSLESTRTAFSKFKDRARKS